MAPMLVPECEHPRTSNIKGKKTHRLIRLMPDIHEIVSSSNRLIMPFLEPPDQMGKGGKKKNSILGDDEKEKEKKGKEKILHRYHTIFTSGFAHRKIPFFFCLCFYMISLPSSFSLFPHLHIHIRTSPGSLSCPQISCYLPGYPHEAHTASSSFNAFLYFFFFTPLLVVSGARVVER